MSTTRGNKNKSKSYCSQNYLLTFLNYLDRKKTATDFKVRSDLILISVTLSILRVDKNLQVRRYNL